MKIKFGLVTLLFGFSFFAISQQTDSVNTSFKLKKFSLGVEFGQSPWVMGAYQSYRAPSLTTKIYPYYKLNFGYNFRIKGNNYFVTNIGVAQENYSFAISSEYVEQYYYVETINTSTILSSGIKHNRQSEQYRSNSFFCTIDLSYQRVYSPFKNEKLKATNLIGFTIKPLLQSKGNSKFSYYRDSTNNGGIFIIKDVNINYSYNDFSKGIGIIDYMFNINQGLLYDCKRVQHQFGVNFSLQLSDPSNYFYFRGYFFRIFYSINF